MRNSLLHLLVDPISAAPLQLEAASHAADGEIVEGTLRAEDGRVYPVRAGVPRFVITDDADQMSTAETFAFKWTRRESYDSPQMRATVAPWLAARYGFDAPAAMDEFFAGRRRLLDAGCGSGFSSSLWMGAAWDQGAAEWYGLEISGAIDVAHERLGARPRVQFVQGDILQPPFRPGSFDVIFSEGVLHHTASTEAGLRSLVRLLEPGGELLFYVYRRKAPVREFADDHIRASISSLPPEEAWNALRPLTALARSLAELRAEVEVPEDVPFLGIIAGRHDVQRLLYWHFLKLFWNPDFSFEENNHVNFDWYHPRYAHRHTEEEIRAWCASTGLTLTHLDTTNLSGFTVRAIKGRC